MPALENAHALIVGIANYQKINPLPETVLKDAQDIYNLLVSPNHCGYLADNVQLLLDSQATQTNLRQALGTLAQNSNAESSVLLYISSQGGQVEFGPHAGEYLLPVDVDCTSGSSLAQTAIAGTEFTEALRAIPARKLVVIFDCCHAGGIGQPIGKPKDANAPVLKGGLSDSYYDRLKQGTGRAILASCRSTESSYVLPKASNSLFTQHLLAGLQGGIASDDGLIRIFDLFEYVQRKVTGEQPNQHPIFKAELEENFPIALYLGGQKGVIPQEEWTYDLFVSYAEADRAWVEGYLLDALEKAEVRCTCESAFAIGVPRILEFERAIRQSRYTLLVISEAYLADDLTRFTDILAQSYGEQVGTWPVIPLTLQEGLQLPPRLKMLEGLKASTSEEWEAAIERLCHQLKHPLPPPSPKPACPYPGMIPFSENDKGRFFGRDEEIEELLRRLRLHPFLTVIGPSGSGKSSLVFAGLIPKLKQSRLFGTGKWCICSLRPGTSPLANLQAVLGGEGTSPLANLQAVLGGDVTALEVRIQQLLSTQPDARRLLLVIDQFEELFTLAGAEAIPFQQALLTLTEILNVYLILTVRAEFYPDLMGSLLWEKIRSHRFEVLPLDEKGLKQAIVRPAEGVEVSIDSALVERLLADAGKEPGTLPLIQETLVLLWQKLERRFLPLRAYEVLGSAWGSKDFRGLQVAIVLRADSVMDELSVEQRQIAQRIFLRLIQFGEGRADTRRQQSVDQLRSLKEDSRLFDQTLFHLADRRLLTLSGWEKVSSPKVDIAHEALIKGWPTLQQWIANWGEAEQNRRRLTAKVEEWVRLGKGSWGLLDEAQLAEAGRWLSSPDAEVLGYDETLLELVEASDRAIQKEKARKRPWFQISLGEKDDPITRKKKQKIEEEARMWREQGKSLKMSNLLQGSKLTDAETFRRDYGDKYPLSNLAQEFIEKSIEKREKSRKIKDILLQINKNLPDYRSQVTQVENIVRALASTVPDSKEFSQSLEDLHVYVNNLEPHSEVLLKQIEELTTNANNSS